MLLSSCPTSPVDVVLVAFLTLCSCRFVVNELIETEESYVKDLGLVVDKYIVHIDQNQGGIPEGLKGKEKIVFGNIQQIYEWHRE